jgi:hypothetical protein
MKDLDARAFVSLFKEVYQKCFGHPMNNALSETESKQLSAQIFDQTGLVVGAKSIKNYSSYVIKSTDGKEENPSVATLDTLARYVLNAPYTDETQRKDKESHYPWWFQYKEKFFRETKKEPVPVKRKSKFKIVAGMFLLAFVAFIIIGLFLPMNKLTPAVYEDFHSLSEDSLEKHGWFVQMKNDSMWNRRGENPEHLTLFTLRGDNWPDSVAQPGIQNLLLRKINADCFTLEMRMSDFFPKQNWQQVGVLLMEDTVFLGKSVRFSLLYNEYFGGFTAKPQIALQGITSLGRGTKLEEFINRHLFSIDSSQIHLIANNLKKIGLRIERRGNRMRFLFAIAPLEEFAFLEAGVHEFPMEIKYIGLFALKGRVQQTEVMPAKIDYFSCVPEKCPE